MTLKIGSRESKLALAQTQIVVNSLQQTHPKITFEIVPIITTGDKILDKTLDKIGGKGLFVKELEEALRKDEIQLTIHSLKDMPVDLAEDLPILAVSPRENPFDVMVLPENATKLNPNLPIGTSSLRRSLQIKKLYPQMDIKPIRGNLITRLEKLENNQFSALILAYAGLKRLNLEHRAHKIFTLDEMIPSAGQGVLAVQGRKDFDLNFFRDFHHPETYQIALGERGFLRELGGGCSSPIACFGTAENGQFTLNGLHVSPRGTPILGVECGPLSSSEMIGKNLAISLKKEENS